MGAQFKSKLFQKLCKLLKIKKTENTVNTPFQLQSSGFIKRTNHSILNMPTVFVSKNKNN